MAAPPDTDRDAEVLVDGEQIEPQSVQEGLSADRVFDWGRTRQNVELGIASNGCSINAMMGNYYGALFAKAKPIINCGECYAWARVVVVYPTTPNATIHGQEPDQGWTSCGTWSQATVPPGYGVGLLGAHFFIHNATTGITHQHIFSAL